MCGIAGIHAYLGPASPVDRAELLRMNDRMAARGPEGSGLWLSDDARIGFAHRRLAIIDLSDSGAQPMHSACGRFSITFNGEIYYRALRAELEAKGYAFRSGSDTEVMLQLYADCGAGMVGKLRGMFAFGLWDADKRILLLARDPLGIKPLYWADDVWTLRFASQAKALPAGSGSRPSLIRPASWASTCSAACPSRSPNGAASRHCRSGARGIRKSCGNKVVPSRGRGTLGARSTIRFLNDGKGKKSGNEGDSCGAQSFL